LSERDFLRAAPNLRDADLRLRVDIMRGRRHDLPAGMSVDERALAQVQKSAADWHRRLGSRPDAADARTMTGVLLGFAYPDRIAQNRGDAGRFVLANGRGAVFAGAQPLSRAAFIVIADLDAADREARIHLAAPIALDDIERHFGAQLQTRDVITWDLREQALIARRERRLQSILLDSKPLREPDSAAVRRAVLDGIRSLGIDSLPWTPELRQWQARVVLMQRQKVPSNEPWPDIGDAELLQDLEQWAPPWLSGVTRREHFARIDLNNALRARLNFAQSAIMEREAPTHFVVPSGSRLPIDYLDGDAPSLSVRLQEVFGLTETPSVAAKRVPLLLKLLSPAQRPVQITRDLPSFWQRGYHEVKKDLKGRYPKHYWPDDPNTAQPTRRAGRPR
jgi:ATP-dependent helicase HrpB